MIDWPLCLELAAGKEAVAKEILQAFLVELDTSEQAIQAAFAAEDFAELKHQVHRLHGACCYCGVPPLKLAAKTLEASLNAHEASELILEQYQQLIAEIESVKTAPAVA
jgi:two-component system, NarL family, sensor histidine kinase BarA